MSTLEWEPLTAPRLISFTLTGAGPGRGPFLLDPGTGHTRTLAPNRPVVCPYPTEGVYMAHVLSTDDKVVASTQVAVRSQVRARLHTPPQEQDTVHLVYDGTDPTLLEIDWGDGTTDQGWHTPGQAPTARFTAPGSYAGAITDVCARRTTRQPYLIQPPATDPAISITPDAQDSTRRTVTVELTRTTGRGPIEVDWDDGTPPGLISDPSPGARLKHHYTSGPDQVYLVACYYTSAPGESTVKAVKIPWPR